MHPRRDGSGERRKGNLRLFGEGGSKTVEVWHLREGRFLPLFLGMKH